MEVVRTRWTGGGSRSGACLTEVIVYFCCLPCVALMALYVEPSLARDGRTGAVAISRHTMWCGFSRFVFGPKYLSEVSNQALARPCTCDAAVFSTDAEAASKQAP